MREEVSWHQFCLIQIYCLHYQGLDAVWKLSPDFVIVRMAGNSVFSIGIISLLWVFAGCGGNNESYCCQGNSECIETSEGLHSCSMDECGDCVLVEPLSISIPTWKDAVVGNSYEVEIQVSGGREPYTFIVNDGQENTYPSWLTLAPGGEGNIKAKLLNKAGQLPLPGDIDDTGIPIKITVMDYTKKDDADRPDNKGVSITKTLKVTGCLDNNCAVCSSKQQMFCNIAAFGTAICNFDSHKIKKCWTDSDGCLIWQDQERDCDGNETCTVALADGLVACTCKDTFTGDSCNQCLAIYTGYPNCHNTETFNIENIAFNMKWVPGGTFPTGTDDSGTATVNEGFWMGETEVTYELWSKLYIWSTGDTNMNGSIDEGEIGRTYTFIKTGSIGCSDSGSQQQPVTFIRWLDAVVWCNAASEFAGLAPVYKYQNVTVKNSTNSDAYNNLTVDATANGFRLPGSMEWECAARYQDGSHWTAGSHVSGDTTSYCYPADSGTSTVFGNYAWYDGNSNNVTHDVATKTSNTLGIYDMSGNVAEWCFDWYTSGSSRVARGGSWFFLGDYYSQVGQVASANVELGIIGFRLSRSR